MTSTSQERSSGSVRFDPGGVRPSPIPRDDMLLYVIAFAVIGSGLWAIWFTLGSPEVAFLFACGVASGFAVSVGLRSARKPLLYNLLSVVALLMGILFMRYGGYELVGAALPFWAQLTDPAVGAASSLGLLLVLTCFFLNSRQALIFTTVPVLAVYGLLASQQDPRIVVGFLCYLISAIFLLVYEHTLELKDAAELRLPRHESEALPRTQLIVSSGIFLCVLVLALSFTAVLMTVLSRDRVAPALEGIGRLLSRPAQKQSQNKWAPITQSGPQTDVRVGLGPLTPGRETIMHVKAASGELWRQRSYDLYTGSGWSTASGQPPIRKALRRGAAELSDGSGFSPTAGLRQTFRLEVPFSQGLPAAAEPVQVAFDPARPRKEVSVDRFGCLVSIDSELHAGETYTVVSEITRANSPPSGATLSQSEQARCLQVPLKARRVRDLVAEFVPRDADPLRKVVLLLGHLQSGEYRYTLQAPAVPEEQDAASFFLFESREGYCDLFATSFALMCRAAGLPSRFTVGYAEGRMTATGEYEVTAADAHAWVEVFIPDRGWLTFDPTPPGQEAVAQQEARKPRIPAWQRFVQRVRVSLIFLVLTVIVVGALVKVLWFDPWWQRHLWERRQWSTLDGRIVILYSRMCRLLAGRGLPRLPSQTPLEYLDAIGASQKKVGLALAPADELTSLFVRARYGRDEVDAQTVSAAQAAYQRFRRLLGRKQE